MDQLPWIASEELDESVRASRSVMPLNTLGRTRTTMVRAKSRLVGMPSYTEPVSWLGLQVGILLHERGMSSRPASLLQADYVPVFCTHRPSLLPIRHFS